MTTFMFHIAVTCSSIHRLSLQHFHCYRSGENNSRGQLISWIICCVIQPSACCCYRLMGPCASIPGGSRRLTHSHAVMESASHHRNPNATTHFHGLAEKQPSKQKNHTRSFECSSISLQTIPLEIEGKTIQSWKKEEKKGLGGGFWGQKILEVTHHCWASHLLFKLFFSGSRNLNNSTPEKWPVGLTSHEFLLCFTK